MPIDPEMLALCACPACLGPLREESDELVCQTCQARFAIQDGIPNLLLEDARLPEGVATVDQLLKRYGRSDREAASLSLQKR